MSQPHLDAVSERFDRLNVALAVHYSIESELGAGGMATVYLAEHLKHAQVLLDA